MFWKAFKVTLGVLVAMLGLYILVIVLVIGVADGWLVKYSWILGILGVVAIRVLMDAWREFRKDLNRAERLNEPDPRVTNANLN